MLLWKHQYPMNLKKFFLSPIFPNSKKNYQDTKNCLNSSMNKNKLWFMKWKPYWNPQVKIGRKDLHWIPNFQAYWKRKTISKWLLKMMSSYYKKKEMPSIMNYKQSKIGSMSWESLTGWKTVRLRNFKKDFKECKRN